MQVKGRVSQRQERLQLICKGVTEFQVPAELPPESIAPDVGNTQRLVIRLTQTEREDEDVATLHKVMDALRTYPGKQEVRLTVATDGESVPVAMSVTINICPALRQRLVGLVGAEGVRVE